MFSCNSISLSPLARHPCNCYLKKKQNKTRNSWLICKRERWWGREGSGERGAEKGLFSLLGIPKKFVPLLLNVLNYRPLQAVPRPFLGSRHYNKCIVCLRGVPLKGVWTSSVSVVSPCNAEKVHCGPWAPGGMKPMNGRRLCCVSPWNLLCAPARWPHHTWGTSSEPSLEKWIGAGVLEPVTCLEWII